MTALEPAAAPRGRPDARIGNSQARHRLDQVIEAVASVLWGKPEAVRLLVAAVMARGHVLIEDVPGVGKTTLARAVARVLGCSFARVQFTADMLPSDVLGMHLLEQGELIFHKGPIFAHVVLADEINRASPKTQSAMLEAMSDRQVTMDEVTLALPEVFVVLATQNPVEHHGAYPLPESQLDRFTARLSLGYPPREQERELIQTPAAPARELGAMKPILDPDRVAQVQHLVDEVSLGEPAADYLLALVEATRRHPDVVLGCSPRGAMLFAGMARAWAFVDGRDYVLPDDIKQVAAPVLTHRLIVAGGAPAAGRQAAQLVVEEILRQVPVPR